MEEEGRGRKTRKREKGEAWQHGIKTHSSTELGGSGLCELGQAFSLILCIVELVRRSWSILGAKCLVLIPLPSPVPPDDRLGVSIVINKSYRNSWHLECRQYKCRTRLGQKLGVSVRSL